MRVKCQKQEYILDSKWLKVRKDCLLFDDGKIMDDFYLISTSDIVLVVAVNKKNDVILKTEYRYPHDQMLTELPGGMLSKSDEPPLEAAKRELIEETGCESDKWELLGKTYDYPARNTSNTYLYLARDCIQIHEQKLDEFEKISFGWVPFQNAINMVLSNRICVNNSANALLRCAALYPEILHPNNIFKTV